MEKWAEIRRLVKVEQHNKRSVCRDFNIHWDTLVKILEHTEPPGIGKPCPFDLFHPRCFIRTYALGLDRLTRYDSPSQNPN